MRLLSPDVTAAALEHEPLPPDEVVAVRLTARECTVWTVTERVRKIWMA